MKPSRNEYTDVLVIEVAGQRHGLLLTDVVEVVQAVAVERLLKAPAAVEGIINLRGTIVPVLDIRMRFDLPPKDVEPSDRMVIVRTSQRHAIIRVDRTNGIISAEAGALDKSKAAASKRRHVKGTLKLPDGLLLIYDLDTFLSASDAEIFDTAVAGEA